MERSGRRLRRVGSPGWFLIMGGTSGGDQDEGSRILDHSGSDPNHNHSPVNSVSGNALGAAYFDLPPTHSRTGRTSGLATPATRGLSPDVSRNMSFSPKAKTGPYSDLAAAGSGTSLATMITAGGLGITPFDREGLMSRTESKERLAPRGPHLGGSRVGSPTRKGVSSLVGVPLKESVE